MHGHHDEVNARIPETSVPMTNMFQEEITLHTFVDALRGCSSIVHAFPLLAFSGRICIKTDIRFHRDAASSAKRGVGAGTGTCANTPFHNRAAELSILAMEIVSVGLHF